MNKVNYSNKPLLTNNSL